MLKQEPTETVTFVTFDGDENNDNSEPVEQYTVVNISDVSAYQNEHTVIEDNSGTNRILSTTQNEDGTLTYMVATDASDSDTATNYEGKTVFFKLVMPEENVEHPWNHIINSQIIKNPTGSQFGVLKNTYIVTYLNRNHNLYVVYHLKILRLTHLLEYTNVKDLKYYIFSGRCASKKVEKVEDFDRQKVTISKKNNSLLGLEHLHWTRSS